MQIEDIIYRLKALRPGESITYYKGNLANNAPSLGNHLTARLAWDLHEEGKVQLIQRRLGKPKTYLGVVDWHSGYGPGFEYIVTGKSRRKSTPNFNAHLRTVMEAV